MYPIASQLIEINKNLLLIEGSISNSWIIYAQIAGIIVSFISVSIAAYAAVQSKKATKEISIARINEVRPVLKHYTFEKDSVESNIIVNIQCKGGGTMYNLTLIRPSPKQHITDQIEPNTSMQTDFRIPLIKNGKVIFEYEDIFGRKYRSWALVQNSSLISSYTQEKI